MRKRRLSPEVARADQMFRIAANAAMAGSDILAPILGDDDAERVASQLLAANMIMVRARLRETRKGARHE